MYALPDFRYLYEHYLTLEINILSWEGKCKSFWCLKFGTTSKIHQNIKKKKFYYSFFCRVLCWLSKHTKKERNYGQGVNFSGYYNNLPRCSFLHLHFALYLSTKCNSTISLAKSWKASNKSITLHYKMPKDNKKLGSIFGCRIPGGTLPSVFEAAPLSSGVMHVCVCVAVVATAVVNAINSQTLAA